jgi:futalosine hydrolase
MNILVCSPTEFELGPFIKFCKSTYEQTSFSKFKINPADEIEIIITGVSSTICTHSLTKYFTLNPIDLAIQIGVAGTFDKSVPLGSVFEVKNDCFADWGAETNEKDVFVDLFDLQLANKNQYPFTEKMLESEKQTFEKVQWVNAITVNMLSTNSYRNSFLIESMEGAAFAYTCKMSLVDFTQLRGISNHVGDRNKESWELKLAIKNVNEILISWIKSK